MIHQFPAAEIARIRALMPNDVLKKADRVARINGRYIGLSRDTAVKIAFEALIASIAVIGISDMAKPDKRRIVALCGDSGAGKTTALLTHTADCVAMQPYVNDDGITVHPMLMMTAPSPCTPKQLAYEGLHKMGYPVRPSLPEGEMWRVFRNVLKAHRVMFLVIDEAQHAVDASNRTEIMKIGNALKNLVQMPDWPVRIVLAGVSPLEDFLSRKQLANRATIIPFGKMLGTSGEVTMAEVMRQIIFDHAEMKTTLHLPEKNIDSQGAVKEGELPPNEFIKRLLHGCDHDFGTIVQMIRGAVEQAINADSEVVTNEHFADSFESSTGYEEFENVFLVKNWAEVKPYSGVEMKNGDRSKRHRRSQADKG